MMDAIEPTLSYGPRPDAAALGETYDVCIIGSGAAGSVAADVLARSGFTVLILESGPFVSSDTSYDRVVMASEMALGRTESGTWAPIAYPWTTCNVGGGTMFYGGASFRNREADFAAGQFLKNADLNIDWPFPYDTLAPHYDAVEERIGIAADPLQDPTAPPGSHEHLLPPVPTSQAGRLIKAAARELDMLPFPTPLAILTTDRGDRAACSFDSPCIEFACPTGAKGDSTTTYLEPLKDIAGCRLFAGLHVVRLRRRNDKKVEEVEAIDITNGEHVRFRARCFVLAANAIQTAALLLRSADSHEPNGMGNASGLVGRGLSFKANGHVTGYRADAELAERSDGPFSTVSILDRYVDPEAPGGLGGLMYESAYGFRYSKASNESVVRVEVLVPDQPSSENRVLLTSRTDRFGLPRLALVYNTHPRDMARLSYMLGHAERLVRAAGCREVWREAEAFHLGSCHLHGTCRAATDPALGVVDLDGRVHSCDNVFVADGAFMPFPAGVNPTLTIQAIAHRVATVISEGFA